MWFSRRMVTLAAVTLVAVLGLSACQITPFTQADWDKYERGLSDQ